MRSVLRATLLVLGVAAIVYGAASLTGGWLGTPPWWERHEFAELSPSDFDSGGAAPSFHSYLTARPRIVPRKGREWISGGVVAVGVALVGASLVRRRRAAPPA